MHLDQLLELVLQEQQRQELVLVLQEHWLIHSCCIRWCKCCSQCHNLYRSKPSWRTAWTEDPSIVRNRCHIRKDRKR